MTFNTLADMQEDTLLRRRLVAAVALEGDENPLIWVNSRIWSLVTQPGWAEAYAYAKDTGSTHPGSEEGAVTDSMILSAVQLLRSP